MHSRDGIDVTVMFQHMAQFLLQLSCDDVLALPNFWRESKQFELMNVAKLLGKEG